MHGGFEQRLGSRVRRSAESCRIGPSCPDASLTAAGVGAMKSDLENGAMTEMSISGRVSRGALVALVTLITGTAMAQSAGSTPPPNAGGTRPLEGTHWRATELAGKPTQGQDARHEEAYLQFQAGRVSGFDGCNRLTGSYQLNGDRVTFGQMAGTQMACLKPTGTEEPLRDALKNASRLTI